MTAYNMQDSIYNPFTAIPINTFTLPYDHCGPNKHNKCYSLSWQQWLRVCKRNIWTPLWQTKRTLPALTNRQSFYSSTYLSYTDFSLPFLLQPPWPIPLCTFQVCVDQWPQNPVTNQVCLLILIQFKFKFNSIQCSIAYVYQLMNLYFTSR